MSPSVLVAGVGNLFFGDDGFGPEVARRLAASDTLPKTVCVVDYGIRGMHLAHDLLAGYSALVVVDAIPGTGGADLEPGKVVVLEVGTDDLGSRAFDPHGMDPLAVLGSAEDLGGTLPPTYVVGCRPVTTDEGIGLSLPVEAAVPVALDTIRRLVQSLVSEPVTTSRTRG